MRVGSKKVSLVFDTTQTNLTIYKQQPLIDKKDDEDKFLDMFDNIDLNRSEDESLSNALDNLKIKSISQIKSVDGVFGLKFDAFNSYNTYNTFHGILGVNTAFPLFSLRLSKGEDSEILFGGSNQMLLKDDLVWVNVASRGTWCFGLDKMSVGGRLVSFKTAPIVYIGIIVSNRIQI